MKGKSVVLAGFWMVLWFLGGEAPCAQTWTSTWNLRNTNSNNKNMYNEEGLLITLDTDLPTNNMAALAIDEQTSPPTIWAGTSGNQPKDGIWKSAGSGDSISWQRRNRTGIDELKWLKTDGAIHCITIGPPIPPSSESTVYCGAGALGIFMSTDGGASWTDKTADNADLKNATINCIAFDPQNYQILYAGTSAKSIWKSSNSGDTWDLVYDTKPQIMAFAFDKPSDGTRWMWAAGTAWSPN